MKNKKIDIDRLYNWIFPFYIAVCIINFIICLICLFLMLYDYVNFSLYFSFFILNCIVFLIVSLFDDFLYFQKKNK